MANKKTIKTSEVKTMEQLSTELSEKQLELLQSRRGSAAGELTNPRVITTARKDIARLLTSIRQLELVKVTEDK